MIATGQKTAPPRNKTPHWRTLPRPKTLPGVAPAAVQAHKPDLARDIQQAARQEGMSMPDFLLELVWAGWLEREAARG